MRPVAPTAALLAAALLLGPAGCAQEPSAQAAAAPAVDPEAFFSEFQAADAELRAALGAPGAVMDPAHRERTRGEAVPALLKVRGLLAEATRAGLAPPGATGELDMMLILYGHEGTTASLEEAAAGDDPAADAALGALITADLLRDPDAAVDRFAQQARRRPGSDALAGLGVAMLRLPGVQQPQKDRILELYRGTLTGSTAARALAAMELQAAADARRQALVGRPLVLEGATASGGTLSTARWRGKVVLVNFWATWCPACVAGMPDLVALRNRYRAAGLEVLGVSGDETPAAVTAFAANHPGVDWPHIMDTAPGHPDSLGTELGVTALPTMFLIDRQGIVRSVTAREHLDTLIPQLLAEAPAEGTPASVGEAG